MTPVMRVLAFGSGLPETVRVMTLRTRSSGEPATPPSSARPLAHTTVPFDLEEPKIRPLPDRSKNSSTQVDPFQDRVRPAPPMFTVRVPLTTAYTPSQR